MYICARTQDSGPSPTTQWYGLDPSGGDSLLKSKLSVRTFFSRAILLRSSTEERTLRSSWWFAERILTLEDVLGQNIDETYWYLHVCLSGSSCRPKQESSKTWITYLYFSFSLWTDAAHLDHWGRTTYPTPTHPHPGGGGGTLTIARGEGGCLEGLTYICTCRCRSMISCTARSTSISAQV